MNYTNLFELIIRFSLNLAFILVIVRYLYYTTSRRKDYLFTYILISSVIFLLCYLLVKVQLEMAFALGLFAIFGIIRYRTRQIPIREMTYLFLVIGVSVINALTTNHSDFLELGFANLVLILITYLLEKRLFLKHESRKAIEYEKIGLIKPANRELLLKDLEDRTGLKINRIEIGKIDFLRDAAHIDIYYYEADNKINLANDGDDDDEVD